MPIQHSPYAVPRTDLGIAFHEFNPSGQNFIARSVFPVKTVSREASTLSVITRENTKRANVKHANGGVFGRVILKSEDLAYTCKDYGLEGPVTDTDRQKYASDYDAEIETTQVVKHKMMIEEEIRVKDVIFNPTTFTGSALYTDNSTAPWDAAGSDIIGQVRAAALKVFQNTGVKPDALVIGYTTLINMLGNTGIKNQFPGAELITQKMIEQAMPAIFGLERLIVGAASYDGANDGQDAVMSDIWGDDYASVCKIQDGSMANPGLGRTVIWDQIAGTDGLRIDTYREEQTESDIVRVRQYQDEFLCDKHFAHLMLIDAA